MRVFEPPKIAKIRQSQLDDTVKYLLTLSDGNTVETVRMSYLGKDIKIAIQYVFLPKLDVPWDVFLRYRIIRLEKELDHREILAQVLMAQESCKNF